MTALLDMEATDSRFSAYSVRRYYDPQTGQFISVDPLVDQTTSPYGYAGEDPINTYDLNGLARVPGLILYSWQVILKSQNQLDIFHGFPMLLDRWIIRSSPPPRRMRSRDPAAAPYYQYEAPGEWYQTEEVDGATVQALPIHGCFEIGGNFIAPHRRAIYVTHRFFDPRKPNCL